MNRFQFGWQILKAAVLSFLCWVATGNIAWAEGEGKSSATSWTLPYALVLACIALGLLVVLRPTFRRHRDKPQEYVEKNILRED
jgi:hypothetical protein